MGLILGVIAVLVIIGLCSSDDSDEVEYTYQDDEECWRCGEMVSPDSDGDYICSCGRRWR